MILRRKKVWDLIDYNIYFLLSKHSSYFYCLRGGISLLRLPFHSSQVRIFSIVVSVLDGIVRSAWQEFADLRPLVSQYALLFEKDPILLFSPGSPFQVFV